MPASSAADALRTLQEEWAGLAPAAGYEEDARRLGARFHAAARTIEARLQREAALGEARAHLEALVLEAEALAAGSEADAAANEANLYYQEQLAKFLPLYVTPPFREGYELGLEVRLGTRYKT